MHTRNKVNVRKMAARKIMRFINEGARDIVRDIATRSAYLVSRRQRKKVEMLFAHLKRMFKLDCLRPRGPIGAKDEFHLAAAAQNLRKLAMMQPLPGLATGWNEPGPARPLSPAAFSTRQQRLSTG